MKRIPNEAEYSNSRSDCAGSWKKMKWMEKKENYYRRGTVLGWTKKRRAQAGKQGGRRTGRRATKRAKPTWHRMHNKCWVTINWSETMEVVGATCSKLCSQASTIELLARIPAELRRSRGNNALPKDWKEGPEVATILPCLTCRVY